MNVDTIIADSPGQCQTPSIDRLRRIFRKAAIDEVPTGAWRSHDAAGYSANLHYLSRAT